MIKCFDCRKVIAEDEKYACLWMLPKVCFLCIPCSEKPEFTDITDELTHDLPQLPVP